jgi:uncharacterized protein YndB with AHSA1/START domain
MLKVTLIVAGVVCLLVAIVIVVGYLLPVAHVASAETNVDQPPDRVFALLTDVAGFPRWRSDVKSVELLGSDPPRWREHGSNGDVTFEVTERQPPRRLVTRIADQSLPFGGTWTYELTPAGSGTRLTITEHGTVFNPVFRFMSRFVFGHAATIERFLKDIRT